MPLHKCSCTGRHSISDLDFLWLVLLTRNVTVKQRENSRSWEMPDSHQSPCSPRCPEPHLTKQWQNQGDEGGSHASTAPGPKPCTQSPEVAWQGSTCLLSPVHDLPSPYNGPTTQTCSKSSKMQRIPAAEVQATAAEDGQSPCQILPQSLTFE